MASDNYTNDIERLLAGGSGAASGATDPLESAGVAQGREATDQLSKQIADLVRIAQQQVETTRANTLAIESTARGSQATGIGADVAKSAGNFLLKGLTLGPLIGGLAKLFGGSGDKSPEPAIERFALPEPIRAEAGLSSDGSLYSIARGSGDQPRVLSPLLTASEPQASVGGIETVGRSRTLRSTLVQWTVRVLWIEAMISPGRCERRCCTLTL